jgi:hypothetical protein
MNLAVCFENRKTALSQKPGWYVPKGFLCFGGRGALRGDGLAGKKGLFAGHSNSVRRVTVRQNAAPCAAFALWQRFAQRLHR